MEAHPLRFLRNLGRSREIATVLINYGFDEVVERLGLLRYLQWGRRVFRRKRGAPLTLTRPQRIRRALEDLGPTFIKFGQVMSTRPDVVPADVVAELRLLQECVPPFPSEIAVSILERELDQTVDKLFAEFDPQPIAAASLAQVHRARHFDGTPLAIKIRRPNAVRDVERDLSLMMELASLIERHIPEAQAFDPVGLVNQFSRSVRREVNFTREARTIDEFARLFRHDATILVPRVYWDLSTEAVVTMQFVDGLRMVDPEEIRRHGIPPEEVAANGARIFMKMAFEYGLFHGDPHPGNLRVLRDGTIGVIDFGLVGILEDDKREDLVDFLLSMARHDVAGTVDVVLRIGHPYREIDRPLLRADVRDFVETYYGVELERLDMARLLGDFVAILTHHGIRYPADLMLLIRALVTLEGVGRNLDPAFNLSKHLAPFVEQVVRDRQQPGRIARRLLADGRRIAHAMHDLPLHLEQTMAKLATDDLKIQFEHRNLDRLITELDRSGNRLAIGLITSALIVASALVLRSGEGWIWLSAPLFALSSLLGVWLIFGVFRSGRL